jgi:acetoin utilization deacetylase AcuC-like enzyme
MSVIVVGHESGLDHLAGVQHPERPERLAAVRRSLQTSGLLDALTFVDAAPATRADLERVHSVALIDQLSSLSGQRVRIDDDTVMTERSWTAAVHAAGAGLTAAAELQRTGADAAFCVVRPPGHHATFNRSMGFCLVNSAAVLAASLAANGERVAIVDIDAHHGNGTQDIFEARNDVLFVSFHQWPLYPGTGALTEQGIGAGTGFTMNLPVPPGATGDLYLRLLDGVVAQRIESFAPTAVIISAGFDAHRDDPITDLGLTSGDYALIVARLLALTPGIKPIVFLEGGYHLDALASCAAATVAALAGAIVTTEAPTSDGPTNSLSERMDAKWAPLLSSD